ncbi:MAG: hypothetical protein AB7H80_01580 [Candidatus Kapaibacterium sp.]
MVKRTRISKDELLSILTSDSSLREEEHPNFLDGIVRLTDGSVLVKTWDGAVPFKDFDEALKVMGMPTPDEDPLRMSFLLPDAEAFVHNCEALCSQFKREFLEDESQLHAKTLISVDEMEEVDRIVERNAEDFLSPEKFRLLCAFLGESFRRAVDGKWIVKATSVEYNMVVELPFVLSTQGAYINVAMSVRNCLDDWNQDALSAEYFGWMLRARQ